MLARGSVGAGRPGQNTAWLGPFAKSLEGLGFRAQGLWLQEVLWRFPGDGVWAWRLRFKPLACGGTLSPEDP